MNNNPFQFVPYANDKHDYPPLKHQRYHEYDANTGKSYVKYGKVIYVGTVESNMNDPEKIPSKPLDLITDINCVVSQPTMIIHFDTRF